MNVRDLIAELLCFNWDAEVRIEVVTKENSDSISDFEINEFSYASKKFLEIKVEPDNQVLVDADDYQYLKNENSHYEDRVAELEGAVSEYERQIQELEEQK